MSHQRRPFFRMADTLGDGTGIVDAIGNYAANPFEFFIRPRLSEIMFVETVIWSITDDAAFDGNKYGKDLVLTAGIKMQVVNSNDNAREDITDGFPVRTNNDLSRLGTVEELVFGSGDQGLQCIINFDEPIIVRSSERLAFVLNDNMSALVHHYFTVSGFIDHEG